MAGDFDMMMTHRRRRMSRAGSTARFPTGAALLLAIVVESTPAATPRLQVFFASDFKDQAYQQAVYKKVAGTWKRPAESPKAGSKAVVIAAILRDGSAPGPRLHHPSGSAGWDRAALEAVGRAAPFGPLPKSYAPASVEVHFHFEYAD